MTAQTDGWYHSKEGKISMIYSAQKTRSKKRGHSCPSYTLQEFKEWLMSQPKFHEIFNIWQDNSFKKELSPSVDRLNSKIGYCFGNIELVDWRENLKRHVDDQSYGIIMISKKTKEMFGKFNSLRECERITGISNANISKVIAGKRKSAGGYIFVKDLK